MTRRTYTDEEKGEALALYVEEGPTAVEAALGIAKSTVHTWAVAEGLRTVRNERMAEAREAIAADRAVLRERLRTELVAKALDLLGRMDEEHIDFRGKDAVQVTFPKASASGCQSYATAAAILLDKYRLEMGEATGRQEHTVETTTDRELRALVAEMRPDLAERVDS